jgi:hypothetical protein
VALQLTSPLPVNDPPPDLTPAEQKARANPWSLQLADGQTCDLMGGATGALGDLRANYGCPNGIVYGDADRSQAIWTVYYQANGSSQLVRVGVRVAYS